MKASRFLCGMLLMGATLTFTACDDDEPNGKQVRSAISAMKGNYLAITKPGSIVPEQTYTMYLSSQSLVLVGSEQPGSLSIRQYHRALLPNL